jgi:UDP-MurNAc hydroxylase
MLVRYVYSACVVVETEDVKILCDPWFTPGAYDGSWYQYPPLPKTPAEVIGEVDYIYVSHIHPDHYDRAFLKEYLDFYPKTRIIIGETSPPHLSHKMRVDGFEHQVLSSMQIGDTKIHVLPNHAYENDNIDTALVVTRQDLSVVNLNDNPFDRQQVDQILQVCPGHTPTFALLPYCGAGPYPQTYEFESAEDLVVAGVKKQEQFLRLYAQYLSCLQPIRAMPFAGKYFLAGPLSILNPYRGVPDATIVLENHPEVSVVLADGGNSFFDLKTLTATSQRYKPYEWAEISEYLDSLSFTGYDYEREICPVESRRLPILPLINSAYTKAISYSRLQEDFWLCFKTSNSDKYVSCNIMMGSDSGVVLAHNVADLNPRCEILIDERYLFGLLTRLYHWNNAEVGSQYRVKRVPDVYNAEVFNFLHRFHA